MNTTDSITHRITKAAIAVAMVVAVMMCVGLYTVVMLKVSPPAALLEVSTPLSSTSRQLAKRGSVLDRRGRILATSRLGYTLFVDPFLIQNSEEVALNSEEVALVALLIGDAVGISPASIEEKIRLHPRSRYVVLEHLLNSKQVDAVRKLHLRCIGLQERLVREYPHGDVGGAIVGFVGFEHSGLAGFENKFNDQLTGESGILISQRDSKQRTLWVSPHQFLPTNHGKDVQLSIDVVIQDIATTRLMQEILRCNAGGGQIVVANPQTGEVLALADILNPREGRSQQPSDPNRKLNTRLGRNRCVTDPYEPGSTFKPFVWAAATELGLVTLDEVLPTPSSHAHRTSYNRPIRDVRYYGPSTWRNVLVKSMNSGMAIVAERFSYAQLQHAIRRFGFGEPTRIGLGGETSGIITSSSNWNDYTQTSVSMGHEIAVTPLQMVQAFCAFARDGTIPQLRLTLADETEVLIVRKAITPEIATLTRQILGQVMTEGTGRRAQSDMYSLFGKSGTAQLPRSDGTGYFEDRYISSFIAGAPMDSPKLVVLCVIDDPDKSIDHYGGIVAGPVVRDVIDATLMYLGVPPSAEYLAQASSE